MFHLLNRLLVKDGRRCTRNQLLWLGTQSEILEERPINLCIVPHCTIGVLMFNLERGCTYYKDVQP